MKKMGLAGGNGMFVTMMVGGVVCTALAASGAEMLAVFGYADQGGVGRKGEHREAAQACAF